MSKRSNRKRRFLHETLEPRCLLASDVMSSQFFSGTLSGDNLLDEFPVTFQAGDEVAVSTLGGNNRPTLTIRDASGNFLAADRGGGNLLQGESYLDDFVAPATGTYLVQINPTFLTEESYGDYELRVDTVRGGQLERDRGQVNNTSGSSDQLRLQRDGNIQSAVVAGTLELNDVDVFQIGYLPAGAIVNIDASDFPAGTELRPLLTLLNGSTRIADQDLDPSILRAVIPEDGHYQFRIDSAEITDGNKVYRFNPDRLSWNDARAAAVGSGGDLVSIETGLLNQRITTELPVRRAWIGLNDVEEPFQYQWSDSTDVTFTNFASGNPNGQNFVAIEDTNGCFCSRVGRWFTPPSDTTFLPSVAEYDITAGQTTYEGRGFRATYAARVTIDDSPLAVITQLTPAEIDGGTVTSIIGTIDLRVNKDLDAATVSASSFTLIEAGPDGLFDTSDDRSFNLEAAFQTPNRHQRMIRLALIDGPLGNGDYRLTVGEGMTDVAGNAFDSDADGTAGGVQHYEFTVLAAGPRDVLETAGNDDPDGATELLITSDVGGTAWQRSQTGRGTIETVDDVDVWKFDLVEGDRLVLNVFNTNLGLVRGELSQQLSNGFTSRYQLLFDRGVAQLSARSTGTYFLEVSGSEGTEYLIDLRVNNEVQFDDRGDSTRTITTEPGEVPRTRVATIGGTLLDNKADRFSTAQFDAGTLVRIEASNQPQWSNVDLLIESRDSSFVDLDPAPNVLVGILAEEDRIDFEISDANNPSTGRSSRLDQQYEATITLTDVISPQVERFSARTQDFSTSSFFSGSFFDFSESIDPETVTPQSNDIRSAGPDDVFGTEDDVVYTTTWDFNFRNDVGTFRITDGPLDNGTYQVTLRDSILDPFGNPLDGDGDGLPGGDWVNLLTVNARSEDEIFGGRDNNSPETATALPITADAAGTGWFRSPLGVDREQSTSKRGFWSFEALAGDQLVVLLNDNAALMSLFQEDPSGTPVMIDRTLGSAPVMLPNDGTYLISVASAKTYRISVNLYRGQQIESDDGSRGDNFRILGADRLQTTVIPGVEGLNATVGGTMTETFDNDYFSLGTLSTDSVVNLDLTNAAIGGALTDVELVDSNDQVITDLDPAFGTLRAVVPADGEYFARVLTRSIIFDSRLFSRYDGFVAQSDAISRAAALGGQLPTVDSQQLADFISDQFPNRNYWLGLTHPVGQDLQWIDGTPLEFNEVVSDQVAELFFVDESFDRWRAATETNSDSVTLLVQQDAPAGSPNRQTNTTQSAYELKVNITSDAPLQIVEVTGLPGDGQSATDAVLDFSVTTTVAVDSASFDESSYQLVAAGDDGQFDTSDDFVYDLTSTPDPDRPVVDFELVGGPLLNGPHRFVLDAGVVSRFGNPIDGNSDGEVGDAFVQEFTVDFDLPGFRFDKRDNDTYQNAVALTLAADTSGTGWSRTERAVGLHEHRDDVDWWSVQIPAGHFATALLVDQTTHQFVNSRDSVFWLDPADDSIHPVPTNHSSTGHPEPFQAIQGGIYLIKVEAPSTVSAYHLEVHTNADRLIETQSFSNVNRMLADGQGRAHLAGIFRPTDRFRLGHLRPGTRVDVAFRTAQWTTDSLRISANQGNSVISLPDLDPDDGNVFSFITPNRGDYSLYVRAIDEGSIDERIFESQYEIDIQITDVGLPSIVGATNLPLDGQVIDDPSDEFRLQFDEPMNSDLLDSNNLRIDNAGPDGIFDTEDDFQYTYSASPLIQSVSLLSPILNYFLQMDVTDTGWLPGQNRVRVTDQVTDRFGNPISNDLHTGGTLAGNDVVFERIFTVSGATSGVVNEIPAQQSHLDAAQLPMIHDTSGTRWSHSQPGRGLIDGVASGSEPDTDWFQFQVVAGDSFQTFLTGNVSSRAEVHAYFDEAGLQPISSVNTTINGFDEGFVASRTGTVYLEVSGSAGLNYQLQVNVLTGDQPMALGASPDNPSRFQYLNWIEDGTLRRFSDSGTIHAGKSSRPDLDHFYLGDLVSGTVVQAGLRTADWSSENITMSLIDDSGAVFESQTSAGFIEWTVQTPGHYHIRVEDPDGGSPNHQYRLDLLVANQQSDVPADVSIDEIVINGGSASRSLIERIEFTLDAAVNVAASDFEILDLSTQTTFRAVNVSSTINEETETTDVALTFGQPSAAPPSIAALSVAKQVAAVSDGSSTNATTGGLGEALGDGNYQLRFTGGSLNPQNDSVDLFFAKFGDVTGDGRTGLDDFAAFRSTFGLSSNDDDFISTMDANRDGTIGLIDFARFRGSFG